MNELQAIMEDVRSGSLPASEIPGFVWFLIRRNIIFWLLLCLAVFGTLIAVLIAK